MPHARSKTFKYKKYVWVTPMFLKKHEKYETRIIKANDLNKLN